MPRTQSGAGLGFLAGGRVPPADTGEEGRAALGFFFFPPTCELPMLHRRTRAGCWATGCKCPACPPSARRLRLAPALRLALLLQVFSFGCLWKRGCPPDSRHAFRRAHPCLPCPPGPATPQAGGWGGSQGKGPVRRGRAHVPLSKQSFQPQTFPRLGNKTLRRRSFPRLLSWHRQKNSPARPQVSEVPSTLHRKGP